MGLVLDGIESASYKRVQKVRLFRGLPHMGSWYRGCAAVSKTAEKCSSRLLPANGRVPKWFKGTGCNPVIRWFESGRVLHYEVVSLMVKPSVVVRMLSVRFWYFLPCNLIFLKNYYIIII